MANPKPLKRQPGGGRSVRLSAYLTDDLEAQLEAHLSGMTAYQRSREIARLLMFGMEAERAFQAAREQESKRPCADYSFCH